MANRIQIRRGSGAPSGSLNYELGWDTTNKILYINDGGTDKAAALPLTGGTLTGDITIANEAPILYLKSTSMDTASTNSTGAYNYIYFTDTNNKLNAFLYGYVTGSSSYLYIGVRHRNTGDTDNVQNYFRISISADNTAEVYFNNPAAWRSGLSAACMVIDNGYFALMPTSGSNGWIKIGTSNIDYGLLPSQSGNAGSGHNSLGAGSWYWKYAYIDEIYGTLNGNITGSASYLSCPNLSTEADIPTNGTTHTYRGSGDNWQGNITSMAYAGILSVDGSYSRGWQMWASRGTDGVLHWRNPNGTATAWENERIILDSTNYTSYTVNKTGSGASGSWGISISGTAQSAVNASNANQVLVWSSNETAIGAAATPANATNSSIWINYRSGSGGTTTDGATKLTDYYFGNRKGAIDDVVIHAAIIDAKIKDGGGTARRIWVTTTNAKPSGAVNGDIVLVKV